MATEQGTWTIFKANESSAPGWKERKLMPNGGLTKILREAHHSRSDDQYLPKVGDRVEEFRKGQHRPSNWVVKSVKRFTSPDTEEKIVVCYCDYMPVEAEWQEVKRGKPVSEMLQAVEAK